MRRVLVVAAVAVVLLLSVPTASAAKRGPVGWWTRSPAASAPDGGITVGNAPDGPVSVAAIEVDLEDGVSSAKISFAQTGGAAPTAAQLVACIISGGFGSVQGGPIEEAPATTCSSTQAAVTSADGVTWTVDITDLVGDRAGSVGVAIVPATGATGVWDLQFDKPALQATAAPSSSGSSSGNPTGPSPFASTATTAYRAPSTGSSSSFAAPKPPAVRAPATTVAPATTTTIAVEGALTDTVALSAANSSSDGGRTGRPVGQAITLAVVAAVIGTIAGFGHKVATARLAP